MSDKKNPVARSLTVAVLGAGHRGRAYAEQMSDTFTGFRVTAVAETDEARRRAFAARHQIADDMVFPSADDLLARARLADVVIIALMDREHVGAAVSALRAGYDVLLEKPMATTLEDCELIERTQRETGRTVLVCHVLRYHLVNQKVKQLLAAGAIGRIVSIDHIEALDPIFFASMFVRGQWSNENTSTFFLMAKCCHDIDLISWFAGEKCRRVSSFGSLSYFTRDNEPRGAADRCTQGCLAEPECPYSALKIHLHGMSGYNRSIQYPDAASDVDADRVYNSSLGCGNSHPEILRALAEGPYGRCVFRSDNTAVDRQVVSLEYDGGIVANFTVCAFNPSVNQRFTRIHGTGGVITCDYKGNWVEVRKFPSNTFERIELPSLRAGHGGADKLIVQALARVLADEKPDPLTSAQKSLETHRIVFAAEESRRTGRVVSVESGPRC
jgi:predicted dehydrogenase